MLMPFSDLTGEFAVKETSSLRNLTSFLAEKPVPDIVTKVPIGPELGKRAVIVGIANACASVNSRWCSTSVCATGTETLAVGANADTNTTVSKLDSIGLIMERTSFG